MPTVVVRAFEGRTVEQKRALVKDIAVAVSKNFKTDPDHVIVWIEEFPRENYSEGGKLAIDLVPRT